MVLRKLGSVYTNLEEVVVELGDVIILHCYGYIIIRRKPPNYCELVGNRIMEYRRSHIPNIKLPGNFVLYS